MADDFSDDEAAAGRDPFPVSGRVAHDAARFGVRADVSSLAVDRRRPSRSWYARKRVLMPVIVLIAMVSFAAGQGTSGPANGDVRLADAPTTALAPPGSGSSVKALAENSSAPVRATPTRRPRKTAAQRATPAHRPTTTQPRRTSRAPEPTRTPRQTPKPKKTKSSCDPNYSEACVPIASDVDCAGGSGNGPAYLSDAAKIIGIDVYDLDADGDGWGCEPW